MTKDLLCTCCQLEEAKITSVFPGETIKELKLILGLFPSLSLSPFMPYSTVFSGN